ncbi:M15 family metallopeptidase [Streptomyces sp. NPDC050418]|uniref:M15 family metallopeptidase n=1 Tax=Streptomyces sp. NPDC050418 TaxID=3365612 RepID=UPI00379D96B4
MTIARFLTARTASTAVALGLTLAASALTLTGCSSEDSSSSFTAASPTPTRTATTEPAGDGAPDSDPGSSPESQPPRHRPLGVADGAVPDGTRVTATIPPVANLDPSLLKALRAASADAARAGVTLTLNSGWRSAAYQDHLLEEAIAKYGSKEEAARWVATAKTSPHVAGEAADLGPSSATTWLSRHGSAYGLCQIYANEPWHYELRPQARTAGCPAMYADPTEDPRMQSS